MTSYTRKALTRLGVTKCGVEQVYCVIGRVRLPKFGLQELLMVVKPGSGKILFFTETRGVMEELEGFELRLDPKLRREVSFDASV